ncbi:hypothetical protein BDZ94DRAFT_332005 [Collybia nuda]|uniref:Uncharacterized protein n=1 Tax=Collybia nuda TaxID=64659 RepID=A0A9P5XVV5_9AGAR|nr:hypothetical protein BDZ94DRAFT_332005 [Collybia nuda]
MTGLGDLLTHCEQLVAMSWMPRLYSIWTPKKCGFRNIILAISKMLGEQCWTFDWERVRFLSYRDFTRCSGSSEFFARAHRVTYRARCDVVQYLQFCGTCAHRGHMTTVVDVCEEPRVIRFEKVWLEYKVIDLSAGVLALIYELCLKPTR